MNGVSRVYQRTATVVASLFGLTVVEQGLSQLAGGMPCATPSQRESTKGPHFQLARRPLVL
jgi:hypothetical protein